MCRSEQECANSRRTRRRCDGTKAGDAARKARSRGLDRAIERLTYGNPANAVLVPRVPEGYWRHVERDEKGRIVSTRAKTAAERIAYLTGTDDVDVVRLGLSDRREPVRKAAARHPLAEQARQPLEPAAGELSAEDAEKIAAYRAHLEKLGKGATDRHWTYLADWEAYKRGLGPKVMSPEQEDRWERHRKVLTGRDRQRWTADRYRPEWEWQQATGRTTADFPTWWAKKSAALYARDVQTGAALPPLRKRDWGTLTYEEASLLVATGAESMDRIPLTTRGWQLNTKWRAEKAAETGNERAALAVDLAARFNGAQVRRRDVRAIPHEDGRVLIQSVHGAPRGAEVDEWVDLRTMDRAAAVDLFAQVSRGYYRGRPQAARAA